MELAHASYRLKFDGIRTVIAVLPVLSIDLVLTLEHLTELKPFPRRGLSGSFPVCIPRTERLTSKLNSKVHHNGAKRRRPRAGATDEPAI